MGGFCGKNMKGFIHIIEIVIVVVAMFFVIYQFMRIPAIENDWSKAKLEAMAYDIIHSLEAMDVDWMDTESVSDALNKTLNGTNMVYDLHINGVVDRQILVGCICSNAEYAEVTSALNDFYLNGNRVHFVHEQLNVSNPQFSQLHDVIIVMQDFFTSPYHPNFRLDDYKDHIMNFLAKDKGIIVIKDYKGFDRTDNVTDNMVFGIDWNSSKTRSGDMHMTGIMSRANATYYYVYKHFYGFPDKGGLKIPEPHTFSNLLEDSEKTYNSSYTKSYCAIEDDSGLCGLIVNSGMSQGVGRTAWMSYPESGDLTSNDITVLMRALVTWLAGESYEPINSDMTTVATSRINTILRPEGMVGFWEFDEGSGDIVHDSSGMVNHGSLSGGVWSQGKEGGSINLSGADDYVVIPNNKSLEQGTDGLSVSAWVRPMNAGVGLQRIMFKHAGMPWKGFYLMMSGSSFQFGVGDGTNQMEPLGGSANNGEWYHVAGVWDKENDVATLYVNSVPFTVSGVHVGNITNTNDLFIGSNSGMWEFFNGTIDEVMFFNRPLSPEEIKSIYDYPGQFMFQPAEIVL
ncbi:MAG: hypothetical protein DRO99_01885, partial [Candidatus Aenigmatarchaeota archaeon]